MKKTSLDGDGTKRKPKPNPNKKGSQGLPILIQYQYSLKHIQQRTKRNMLHTNTTSNSEKMIIFVVFYPSKAPNS